MLPYKEYEQKVYNWFIEKNKKDPKYTFSVRQKANKGSELDYFIGTEKSGYFGTTLFTIPVAFPGSSSDLIDIIFHYVNDRPSYYIEYFQTRSPHNQQNKSALNLVQSIKQDIKASFEIGYESKPGNKMESYRTNPRSEVYTSVESLLSDLDKDLEILIPLVEKKILEQKKIDPSFIAHRISNEEFMFQQKKLKERFDKYGGGGGEPTPSDDNPFKKIIRELDELLKNNNADLKGFSTLKLYKNYVWVADGDNIIGDSIAHYEVTKRGNKLYVELHFEGKKAEKDQFVNSLGNLPVGIEWFDWDKSKSIRVTETVDMYAENIPLMIEEKLSILERSIGDKIRSIITGIPFSRKSKSNKNDFSLNQILFGPPGTGKTYHTINKAVSIIDNLEETALFQSYPTRNDLKNRFAELLIEDWDNPKGQIVFTTFHQSMSYEDFIEGIKPGVNDQQKVIYDVEPGIFKMISSAARDNWLDANHGETKQQSFEDAFTNLKEEWQEDEGLKFPMKRTGNDFTIIGFTKTSIKFKKASGGTGHTLSISTLREYFYNSREFRPAGLGIYYLPVLEKLKSFQPTLGVEKKLKNYVLIIDEINRGNVSQIFGELITLIEEDKRLGIAESLEITLPYTKEKFGVPPNLYIIGTMNTADRSVEALDTALRRRFSFIEMPPKPSVIREYGELSEEEGQLKVGDHSIDLPELLTVINSRIEVLLDRDHLIGHSYFMGVKDIKTLKTSFAKQIIPLLQEYFYGDYGKITLVLGEDFCKGIKVDSSKLKFARAADYDTSVFEERVIYKISDVLQDDFDIVKAIETLYNKEKSAKEILADESA